MNGTIREREDITLKNVALLHKVSIKSTYTKLVLSYFFIAVFITAILSVTLYDVFQNISLKVIQSDSKDRLSQNINNLNLIRSHIFSLGQQMALDTGILMPVYGDEKLSPSDELIVYRKIKNIIYSDSIIHSVCLYNGKTHEIVDTFNVESKDSFTGSMMELLKSYNEYDKFQFIPVKISYKKLNGDIRTDRIITAVFPMSEFSGDNTASDKDYPSISAILVNLDADTLQKNIASTSPDQISNTIIIDNNGNVIFDSNMLHFAGNLSDQEYIKWILESDSVEDAVIKDINGDKSLVVYKKTESPQWTFINIYSFHNLFKEIDRLGIIILFICIGILLAATGFSIISAKTIYSPFKRLLNSARGLHPSQSLKESENSTENIGDVQYLTETFNSILKKTIELESSVNDSVPFVKKELLKKLIKGQYSPGSKMSTRFDSLFKNLVQGNGCFSVIIFSVDDYQSMIKNKKMENEEILFSSMEILLSKAISEYFCCEPVDFENNYIYILIKLEGNSYISSKTQADLKIIHENIQNSINSRISCAIGMPVSSIEDIHISCSNAADIIRYRLVYGYGSFFSHDMEELALKESFITIDKEKEKLIQSIKMCNLEGVEAEISNIINSISRCQYDYIMLTLNQLMLDIVKSVRSFFESDSNELDFNNIYCNLNSIGTLDEIKSFFTLYCKAAVVKIEKKRSNRKSDMINETIAYISSHYHHYDISTESLADMANLTPGYFGKLFAEHTGKTVNEYIMTLRLSKAKELLTSTGLTINDISSRIGFTNSTYFITLFKKSFGISPNQYRNENMPK